MSITWSRIAEFLDASSIEPGLMVFGAHLLRWTCARPPGSELVVWQEDFLSMHF
jgi:hypothetical protein